MAEQDERDDAGGAPKGPVAIKISAADAVAKGVYANLSLIHNNDVEFILDFIFAEPQRPHGHVVARVVTNPKAVKRLSIGLAELIRRYEERFGEIPVPAQANVQGRYH